MPVFIHPQDASPDVRRANTQGLLVISSTPDTQAAKAAYLGKTLVGAGAINVAGAYECEIRTDDWAVIEVELMCSAVTGTFAPTLRRMRTNGQSTRASDAGGNFVAAATELLTLADLNGSKKCKITFTVPGGGSVTFAEGTDPTTPTAIAEYNGG